MPGARSGAGEELPVPVEADGGLLGEAEVAMDGELTVQGDVLALDDGPVHPVPYGPDHVARQPVGMKLDAYIEVLDEELHDAAELGRRRLRVMKARRVLERGGLPGRQRLGQPPGPRGNTR